MKDKRFTTGATIPYLIGALRLERNADEVQPEDISRNDLRGLLISMRDDLSPPDSICIQHCGYVDGYVAAWHSPPPQNRGRISSPNHPDRGLYHCDVVYGHQILDFESLFEALWQGHKEYILGGRFSREWVTDLNGRRKRQWLSFDDCEADERSEIRMTLADPAGRTRSG